MEQDAPPELLSNGGHLLGTGRPSGACKDDSTNGIPLSRQTYNVFLLKMPNRELLMRSPIRFGINQRSDHNGAEAVEVVLAELCFQVFRQERAPDQFVGKGMVGAEDCQGCLKGFCGDAQFLAPAQEVAARVVAQRVEVAFRVLFRKQAVFEGKVAVVDVQRHADQVVGRREDVVTECGFDERKVLQVRVAVVEEVVEKDKLEEFD